MSGDVRAIGTRTNNAELMADCAALGYLDSPVLDATYGLGRFWSLYLPDHLFTNDIDPATDAMDHADFRSLPYPDDYVGTVVLDPPYKLNGTSTGIGASALDAGYGVGGAYSPVKDRMQLILDGALECARVADHYLLVKCQDQVVSGNVVWQTHVITEYVEAKTDFRLIDMLHVQGYRKQPEGRRQLHARRDYSTLLVFEKES